MSALSDAEQKRYQAAYCGLCRTLGLRHGRLSRLALTYDLTFLALLLSSLYEPDEEPGRCRCCIHPCKKHAYVTNSCTEYAADMTIVLTYYKCMDDWQDDKKLSRRLCAALLRKRCEAVKRRWPEQCAAVEDALARLSEIERAKTASPDEAAQCFGHLMEGIFLYRKDRWEEQLRKLGHGLGKYIYLADAAEDLKRDQKRGSYNPLNALSASPRELRPILTMVLSEASEAFEILPLVQDVHLLKNILYSGIWIRYNRSIQKSEKVTP